MDSDFSLTRKRTRVKQTLICFPSIVLVVTYFFGRANGFKPFPLKGKIYILTFCEFIKVN